MGEPLKNKKIDNPTNPLNPNWKLFFEKDVESAVLWLKNEIRKNTDAKRRISNYTVSDLNKLIDSAFPDICS